MITCDDCKEEFSHQTTAPSRERTADGKSVGRCWHHCPDGICERHGDVIEELEAFRETGKLQEDPR